MFVMHQCHPLGGGGTPGGSTAQATPANELLLLPALTNKLLLIGIVMVLVLICICCPACAGEGGVPQLLG